MKSVNAELLFITDDSTTIKALEALLKNEKWRCHFAQSGHQTFNILAKHSIDLVVSTLDLRDDDGFELIKTIREQAPAIIRLFLVDQNRQDHIIKALAEGYAQQVIPKPWIDQELIEILHSALRQKKQQLKYSLAFQMLINSVPLMPALPECYKNVHSCITADEIDIDTMAGYISEDVAISTALLHWANSALFGQRFQVDTIKKAIIVLGTDIVENLILSESINKALADKIPDIVGFNFQKFKQHSMATATISRLLIKSTHRSDLVKQDRAFVSGLLHDMGKLAAVIFFTGQFAKALALAKQKKYSLTEAERITCGSDHAELGSFLAEWWALPPFIVNAICWHHKPLSTPIEQEVITATHVANLLSYKFDYGTGDDVARSEVEQQYLDQFYLNDEAIEILQSETEKTIRTLIR